MTLYCPGQIFSLFLLLSKMKLPLFLDMSFLGVEMVFKKFVTFSFPDKTRSLGK